MTRKFIVSGLCLCMLLFSFAQKKESPGPMLSLVDKDLSDAVEQYKFLLKQVSPGAIPRTYDPVAGKLITSDASWWCSGFYPGTLWYLYEYSSDTLIRREAERALRELEGMQYDSSNHDLGFRIFCSFGNAYRITGNRHYKEVVLEAAKSLASRYRPSIKAIQSWDSSSVYKCPVIIDNLMNLELLEWSSRNGGEERQREIAADHANTTLSNHFRADYSCYHLLDYDLATGRVMRKITRQGAADSSAWSRGQAWALYGYTMLYRFTGDKSYLSLAGHIADFLLDNPTLPADKIPYWDFNAPGIPHTYRDASAAAVMASALLELARYSEQKRKNEYLGAAATILRTLSSDAYKARAGTNGGYLLLHSVGALPFHSEVDVPLTYADYYFVEALLRYKKWYAADSLKYYDGHALTTIGQFHHENNWLRFPIRYKSTLREPVWDESTSSAGIAIRFRTNARQIAVRWTLSGVHDGEEAGSPGVDGVDLYALTTGHWQYVGTGMPKKKSNESLLLRKGDGHYREYLLNLPLYDGVDSLFIGVNDTAVISRPVRTDLVTGRPVIYYGSSIAQGAAASRPGMAYVNMLSRRMNRPFLNFGFSGEGKFDLSVGKAMSEVDAALYVIDCTPNSKGEIICDSAVKLVRLLKKERPEIPVLLVEGYFYEDTYFNADGRVKILDKRRALRKAFEILKATGTRGLYYKTGDGLIGNDHEGTQDGVHPNDLGMDRFATNILPVIKEVLKRENR